MRIGVTSDTHGLFDPALERHFRGVDAIIHAGDIGKLEVIERLQSLAPVLAVEGNVDSLGVFPEWRLETLNGRTVLIRHIFGEIHQMGPAQRNELQDLRPDIVIFGHSHRPYKQKFGDTLLFNPGSSGPKRFSLPRTAGILTIGPKGIDASIFNL